MRNQNTKTSLTLFVLGLLLCQLPLQAQTGFLGKHLELQLDTRLTPAWLTENSSDELGAFKYDVSWCPGIQYTLTENASVGLNYQISKVRYPEHYREGEWDGGKPYAWSDLSVKGISAYYRYYYLLQAPLGPYAQLGLNYYTYSAPFSVPYSSEEMKVFKSYGITVPYTSKEVEISSRMFGLHIEFGSTYTLADYLSISPYMSSGFSIGKGKITNDYHKLRNPINPNTYAEKKIRQMGYLQFGVRIGIIAI
jgi:hypothetical protein